jgi:1-acyl-sn-glycerol-3-phosphate acyltransferase
LTSHDPLADEELARLADRRGEEVTLADKVKAGALWAAGAAWLTPMLGTLTTLQHLVPADRVDWLSRFYVKGQIALTGAKWRAVVHPDVDPNEVYMFAQNHTNHFDHVTLYNATPHFKQGLELESHFKFPIYGQFMKSRGTVPVPVEKEGRTEKIRERMQKEVDRGHSLLVFPEGTRTVDGRVGPFRSGVFFLARDLGLPIVPVAVTGMYDVMRKGSWLIRPGHTVTVHVEKPIPMAGRNRREVLDALYETRRVMSQRVDEYYRQTRLHGTGR